MVHQEQAINGSISTGKISPLIKVRFSDHGALRSNENNNELIKALIGFKRHNTNQTIIPII